MEDLILSVVIVRQRVRPSAGPMTGSGGRSSKHRRLVLAGVYLNPSDWDYWMPRLKLLEAGHDNREIDDLGLS
jgi:hypothetical protein